MSVVGEAPRLADYIETTPGVCGGKPRVRGTRIKVSSIVSRHVYGGQSVDEIVDALPQLTLAQVHATLAYYYYYYYDHRHEVETELRKEDELVERLASVSEWSAGFLEALAAIDSGDAEALDETMTAVAKARRSKGPVRV